MEVPDLQAALALEAEIGRRRAAGWAPALADVVPGARTVLLDGLVDPGATAAEIAEWSVPAMVAAQGPIVEIPCIYDGPDLGAVALCWGVDPSEVGRVHSSQLHVVAFCGFAPGFAYITGIGEERSVARLASPRPSVAAGSIGVAGPYTGIYPRASPGGWHLIGRTSVVLWDEDRPEPALLMPGHRVRFVEAPIGDGSRAGEWHVGAGARVGTQGSVVPRRRRSGIGPARVVRAGALTTVQDGGRPGWAHVGVPHAGALDTAAHRLANRLVGNDATAPILETTMDGVGLAFAASAVVAVTGAPTTVTVDGRPAGWGLPVAVAAGRTLQVGRAQRGVRSYVAVTGGWDVAAVLGSTSADLLSGLGPPPLADGDELYAGSPTGSPTWTDVVPTALPDDAVELDATLGPRHDWLSEAGRATLSSGAWSVSSTSNRIALRLAGPAVERRRRDELASEGLVAGSVQALPDGQLIVFLADHPTTGGYPVVAVVDDAALDRCAQAGPGTAVTIRLDAASGRPSTTP